MDTSSNGRLIEIASGVLTELGDSLWGRRFFRKNYSIYFSRGRCVLCDAPVGILTGRRSESSVKISVHVVEGSRFSIVTEKLKGRGVPKPVVTEGLTAADMRAGVDAIREVLRQDVNSDRSSVKSSTPSLNSTAPTT